MVSPLGVPSRKSAPSVPVMVAASATPQASNSTKVINAPNNIALRMPLSLPRVVSGIDALASSPPL